MTTFQDLNLNPKLLSALESKGYTTPTPIQLQSIPHVLEGKDLLGIAQTGTGKTAAFSLPILHNLILSNKPVKSGCVRALILTPTRELASQIAENIELYGKDLNLRHAVIFGGVSERPQLTTMQRGVDILIATPGRLLDLSNQGHIRFMNLEILVLDEADRMLDMGFINDIKKIITKIPQTRQTLFFSATMPETISSLAHSILKDPAKVEVTPPATTVERINQELNFVAKADKFSLLKHILKNAEGLDSTLVFSRTKHGADRIVTFLEKNSISVAAIHGNKSQGAREKALSGFRSGKVKILVATDIAARGIDVPSISHVINFDIPVDPESYVHRIGRTARAGKNGSAISFCDSSELDALKAIEKTIKFKIPADTSHPFHDQATSVDYDKGQQSANRGSSHRPSSPRAASGRSDERRKPRDSFGDRSKHPRDRKPKEGPSGSLLGFMGFGKKKPFGKSAGKPADRKKEDRGGFGFGGWFGKKSDSRDGEKRGSSESRGNSFGEKRERRGASSRFGDKDDSRGGERRERSPSRFGGESRGPARDSERRSSSPRFGDSDSHGGERRSSSRFGDNDSRSPSRDSERRSSSSRFGGDSERRSSSSRFGGDSENRGNSFGDARKSRFSSGESRSSDRGERSGSDRPRSPSSRGGKSFGSSEKSFSGGRPSAGFKKF